MKHTEPTDDRLDRLLGDSRELGVTEREDMLAAVLERTAPARPRFLPWLALAAATALATVIVVLVRQPIDDELTPRGNKLAASFTLSCLVNGAAAPCEVGAKLAFGVAPRGYRSFAAVAEAPDGTTVWLFPHSIDVSALGPGGVIEEAVLIDGPRGTWVVHGVFGPRPFSRDELRAAIADPTALGASVVKQDLVVK